METHDTEQMLQVLKSIIGNYNQKAGLYDLAAGKMDYRSNNIFDCLNGDLPPPGSRLLDIGCGTGLASRPFAKHGLKIYGVDAARNMLAIFNSNHWVSGSNQADIYTQYLPHEDKKFDIVISNNVFCFLPDLRWPLTEARRVLKPGSLLCFTVEKCGRKTREVCRRTRYTIYKFSLDYLLELLRRLDLRLVFTKTRLSYVDLSGNAVSVTVVAARKPF